MTVVASCVFATALTGCRREASKADAPAAQSAALTAQVPPVEPAEPVPAGQQASPDKLPEVLAVASGPRITVEKAIVDLGEVGTDSKRTGEFRFTNTGNAPLKILDVHFCCGVATRGVAAGQEYAPGQSGVLEFDYSSGSMPVSKVTRELRLKTNDPEQDLVSLVIKASVVRRVAIDPPRLRLFLKRDNADCCDITIRSLDGKAFSIASVKSTANTISAKYDPAVKATEFVLKPRVDMEKLPSNLKGTISIDLTHPECSNLRVLFDVLPEFTVNPLHLMIFNMRPEQPVQREVWILSNYRDDFEIESVSSQNGHITLLDKKKVGNRYQLQIEVKAPVKQGENTIAADVLTVKIKDGETISIPFRGFYVGG
jgi:hypothetical protein